MLNRCSFRLERLSSVKSKSSSRKKIIYKLKKTLDKLNTFCYTYFCNGTENCMAYCETKTI